MHHQFVKQFKSGDCTLNKENETRFHNAQSIDSKRSLKKDNHNTNDVAHNMAAESSKLKKI